MFSLICESNHNLSIDKVEPPNWWVDMKWNCVQLMIYGKGLTNISAEFQNDQLATTVLKSSNSYAFVQVKIPDNLPPATYLLEITALGQKAVIDFPILSRDTSPYRHQGFNNADVVYLITPDRFANGDLTNDLADGVVSDFDPNSISKRQGGDLSGIIDRLPYLQDLGVSVLWLNPVLENNGTNSYHGYAATDLYRIDPRLGSNTKYKELVDQAHAHQIKIIFDHVSNHIGIGHPWVQNLPSENWLNGNITEHSSDKHYISSINDPHADPNTVKLLQSFWFVDSMPDLNQRNPYLANYLIQNTLWWIELTGIDGIREDTYPYADQEFLSRWAATILSQYPSFNIVGEIWTNSPASVAMFQKGNLLHQQKETNLPCVMDFPLCQAFRQYLMGTGKLQNVYEVLAQDFLYSDPNNLLTFFDNHDMPRGVFIAKENIQKTKQVIAMLLTLRGIPQLLYGTEINMVGGESHVQLRANFPGGFPNDMRNAFDRNGRTEAENDIFTYLRKLLEVRKRVSPLTTGKLIHYPPNYHNDVYKYLRISEEEIVLVIINGHDEKRQVDLSELAHWFDTESRFVNLITDQICTISFTEKLVVTSWQTLILHQRP